jgi:hypothetical protein
MLYYFLLFLHFENHFKNQLLNLYDLNEKSFQENILELRPNDNLKCRQVYIALKNG